MCGGENEVEEIIVGVYSNIDGISLYSTLAESSNLASLALR